uniref:Uncharacterized protein n=1 Tax=Varanus komodoensis TaxID=61221 RepID=A0A8D2LNW1_VARKO
AASLAPLSHSPAGSLATTLVVYVKNPHLDLMDEDILYHLDLGTKTHNLPAMFGDVKLWAITLPFSVK